MKKTLLTIVTACLFVVFLAAYSSNPNGGNLGDMAPNFSLKNEFGDLELQKLKGKYVLLAFWSSVDAESRIANVQYDRIMRNIEDADYVAVNFDRSQGVYNEILKNDGLVEVSQFYDLDGEESILYSRYQLGRGMKALLLDKSGKIVAVNPSPQQLNEMLGRN